MWFHLWQKDAEKFVQYWESLGESQEITKVYADVFDFCDGPRSKRLKYIADAVPVAKESQFTAGAAATTERQE